MKLLRRGKYLNLLAFLFLSLMFSVAGHRAVFAQAVCAADFRTQMNNNALMQAERQMVVANTLLRKPDSVLEYSCFDQRVAEVAEGIANVFSDSNRWQNTNITHGTTGCIEDNSDGSSCTDQPSNIDYSVYMGDTYLDGIVNDLVLSAMDDYHDDNFRHSLLGGALNTTTVFSPNVAGAGGTCDYMFNVYHSAQCEDFADDIPFMRLEQLVGLDPRDHPQNCPSTHAVTQSLIEQADNRNLAHVNFDHANAYLDRMISDNNSCNAAQPIPTGVQIVYTQRGEDINFNPIIVTQVSEQDMICLNPGCYYVPGLDCQDAN